MSAEGREGVTENRMVRETIVVVVVDETRADEF